MLFNHLRTVCWLGNSMIWLSLYLWEGNAHQPTRRNWMIFAGWRASRFITDDDWKLDPAHQPMKRSLLKPIWFHRIGWSAEGIKRQFPPTRDPSWQCPLRRLPIGHFPWTISPIFLHLYPDKTHMSHSVSIWCRMVILILWPAQHWQWVVIIDVEHDLRMWLLRYKQQISMILTNCWCLKHVFSTPTDITGWIVFHKWISYNWQMPLLLMLILICDADKTI